MKPLFRPAERFASRRLVLTGASVQDVEAFTGWIEAALSPDWTLADLMAVVERDCGALVSDAAGERIGLAVALVDAPSAGDGCIPFLTIAPARRFRGLGGEAGLALETHLRARFGVKRLLAPVPDGRGLPVYFWLRLGYQPLLCVESPGPLIGLSSEHRPGIWLARDVANGQT